MLLFHGTTEPFVDGILKQGLKPLRDPYHADDWQGQLTGMGSQSHVYLSTRPVAGKGGDPVAFAMDWKSRVGGWPRRRPHGYLVVVELGEDRPDLVRHVIENQDVDRFCEALQLRSALLGSELGGPVHGAWRSLLGILTWLKENRVKATPALVRKHLVPVVTHVDPSLPTTLTPEKWCAFLRDYFHVVNYEARRMPRAVEKRRLSAVMKNHGIRFPARFEEDASHCFTCCLCIGGLYKFEYHFVPVTGRRKTRRWLRHAVLGPFVVARLPQVLRVAQSHFASHSVEDMDSFLDRTWNWAEWYAKFPPDTSGLPRVWHPDFGQQVDFDKLRGEDTQVICSAIPVGNVIGVIRVSDGQKLLPGVRPNRSRGCTLSSTLWGLARSLCSAYRGSPIRVDEPRTLARPHRG